MVRRSVELVQRLSIEICDNWSRNAVYRSDSGLPRLPE